MMRLKQFLKTIVIVFIVGLTTVGCDTKNDRSSNENEREELKVELRSLRDEINSSIEKIGNKIENATDENRERLQRANRGLQAEKVEVERALNDLEHSTSETWGELKEGSRKTSNKVRKQFQKIRSDINELFDNEK